MEQIIHKVYEIPQLKKLSNYRCFDIIYEHIDEHLVKKINSNYFQNGYIYILVSHPAVKMALQYELESQIHYFLALDYTCKHIKENFKGIKVLISK
jgi:hypothetical protein